MSPRGVVLRKEVAGVLRERTILLAIGLQVVVAGFSSFLVVGLAAMVDPDAMPNRGEPLVAVNATGLPRDLARHLHAAGIRTDLEPSDEAAWAAFTRGEAHAALLVARGEVVQVTLGLPDGDLRATIILVKLKDALEAYERQLRAERSERLQVEPVHVQAEGDGGSFGFVYALLVPLLVLLPVILAGALCADALTEEAQRGTLALLLTAPATLVQIVEGKILAHVALAPLLAGAWLLLLGANGLPVPLEGALGILLLTAAGAFLLAVLASFLALGLRDRSKAHTVYAAGFLLLLALGQLLPVSPGNAVARLAAGSGGPDVDALLAGAAALALLAWVALRAGLGRRRAEDLLRRA